MIRIFYLSVVLLCITCGPGRDHDQTKDNEKLAVATVNYPLYYFANVIGGAHISVYFPDINGDPGYWKPTAKEVINFQQADLILANGAGYATWMEKVSLPSSRILFTSQSFKEEWIETQEGVTHSHGSEGEHVHKGIAFTTWLNFKFAIKQAESIRQALSALLPGHAEEFNENFVRLKRTLEDFDKRMERISSRLKDHLIFASHPVYQYLEQGYRLNIHSEHWEPNENPSKDQWAALNEMTKNRQAKLMIWEDEPIDEIKQKLNEMSWKVVIFKPCGNKPETHDFNYVMDKNLKQLEEAIDLMQIQ